MINKFQKTICCLALTSALVGTHAYASTVSITPSSSNVLPSDSLALSINGTDFSSNVDGGGFTLSWDPLVINYTGITISDPPWDTNLVTATNVATGTLDWVLLGDSAFAGTGPTFSIAEVTFDVIGNVGDMTTVTISDALGGWAEAGTAKSVAVSYNNASVKVVPIPAAAWLLMSGIAGLVSLARKEKMG